nr:hypothetical protein HmN_000929000 [Hymenolepis microstoma]
MGADVLKAPISFEVFDIEDRAPEISFYQSPVFFSGGTSATTYLTRSWSRRSHSFPAPSPYAISFQRNQFRRLNFGAIMDEMSSSKYGIVTLKKLTELANMIQGLYVEPRVHALDTPIPCLTVPQHPDILAKLLQTIEPTRLS